MQVEEIPLILLPWLTISFQGIKADSSVNKLTSTLGHVPLQPNVPHVDHGLTGQFPLYDHQEEALLKETCVERGRVGTAAQSVAGTGVADLAVRTRDELLLIHMHQLHILPILWEEEMVRRMPVILVSSSVTLPYSTMYILLTILYSFLHHMESFNGYLAKLYLMSK